jgi:hypothetical protein
VLQPHRQVMGTLKAADWNATIRYQHGIVLAVMQFYHQRLVLAERRIVPAELDESGLIDQRCNRASSHKHPLPITRHPGVIAKVA